MKKLVNKSVNLDLAGIDDNAYSIMGMFSREAFEVYHGFNTTGINRGDRFYHLHKEISDYYPVKILTSFSLDELPGNDGFINVCRKLFKEK